MRHLLVAMRQAKLCLARDMQYRLHFLGRTASWLMWTAMYLAFIEVLLAKVGSIGGWGRHEMRVLYGTYMLIDGISQVCIQPNMHQVSTLVREGILDLWLTKPMDAQFLISTARWDFNGIGSIVIGISVAMVGMSAMGNLALMPVLGYLVSMAAATLTLYALWFISVLMVFKAQRVDGIGFLFTPFFQLCRYPIAAYPPVIGAVLKTVLPLAYVVTVPARILMGMGTPGQMVTCWLVAILALAVSRCFWRYAISNYTSASS